MAGDSIARMKKSGFLITTARGGIVDENALVTALEKGLLRGAGIYVWVDAPPPLNHKLINFDNVILTMHTAGITEEAKQRQGIYAARQWLQIIAGENSAPGVIRLISICEDKKKKDKVQLDKLSNILLIGCEGNTDQEMYQKLINQ